MTTNESNYKAYRAADAAATRAFLAYEELRAVADAAWLKAVSQHEEPGLDQAIALTKAAIADADKRWEQRAGAVPTT